MLVGWKRTFMSFEREHFENAFFASKRIRARTTKFEINRTTGANATLKMSNPEEMAAPRTHESHCFALCILFSPRTRPLGTRGNAPTRTRGESRILHRKQITRVPSSEVWRCYGPSRLLAGMHTSQMRGASFRILPTIVSRVTRNSTFMADIS